MDIAVYNKAGTKGDTIAISDHVFAVPMKRDLIWQVATSQMSNIRQVIAHTKDRAAVRGGGRKPWKQKGTGRARHGSIRSPIWVGGGVAHGPTKEVNFKRKVNRGQGRAALAVVLSDRVRTNRMLVVEEFLVASGKTKDAMKTIAGLGKRFDGWTAGDRILVVLPGTEADVPTRRATANIRSIQTTRAQDLNALTVLSFPYMVVARDAVTTMEKAFAKK